MNLSTELKSYLTTMVNPPEATGLQVVIVEDLSTHDFAQYPDESSCGFLIQGTPTEDQAQQMLRACMPGAYILMAAAEEDEFGDQGAILMEDTGFDIRDAIFVATREDQLHYCAKASRSEREAGCQDLPVKTAVETVQRDPESAGAKNPRAGANRQAGAQLLYCEHCDVALRGVPDGQECPDSPTGVHSAESRGAQEGIRNFHPTVKSIKIMERLVEDLPVGKSPVLDPFMGSGTTGIACTITKQPFIGIEQEQDFIQIADARIAHWTPKITLEDFFG